MRAFGILMALAVSTAVLTPQAQVQAQTRTDPAWLSKPSLQEIWDYYPKLAAMFEISGGATVTCRVEATSDLADCQVENEFPKGFGFGAAATAVAYAHMKVKPGTIDGRPDPTTSVSIPVTFTARSTPGVKALPHPPAPKPDVAMLAERAARGDEIFLYVQRLVAGFLGDMEGGGADADPTVAAAFKAAGQTEVRAREGELRGLVVGYYAQALGETRLKAQAGPDGAARRSSLSDPELEPLIQLVAYELDDVTHTTKAKACAKVECGRPVQN